MGCATQLPNPVPGLHGLIVASVDFVIGGGVVVGEPSDSTGDKEEGIRPIHGD